MELKLALDGNLQRWFDEAARSIDRGQRGALRRVTGNIGRGVQRRVKSGGFKTNFAKLVKYSVKNERNEPYGEIRSVATYSKGQRTGPVDLVQLFAQGETIRAKNGSWLAIPTAQAPLKRGKGRRQASPSEAKQYGFKLAFIPAGPGKAVIINVPRKQVWWVLVKKIDLRKRYELNDVVDRWVNRFDEVLAQEIIKAFEKNRRLAEFEGRR